MKLGESSTAISAMENVAARMSYDSSLVSDDVLATFEYVVDLWMCSVLSYFGIVINIVTIVVFAKMGFQDTVNISMTCIAVWDLVKCFCAALMRMYGPIDLGSPAFSKSWQNVTFIVFGYLYAISGYTSGAMAAYVSIERCLCVSMPFTVRYLLTRKLVTVTNVTISIFVFGSYVISYLVFDFFEMTDLQTNKTIIAYKYNALSVKAPGIIVYVNVVSIFYPMMTFGITCISTMVITYHLKKASIFRAQIKAMETSDGSAELSSRDRQVIKMLLVIIAIYIACVFPRVAFFLAVSFVPGFATNNMLWITLYIMSIFDFINSDINIFVFYFMTSHFKSTFRKIFHMD